jgi:1-acyl-sn-glycerol-3-phosphate acyltransferase
MNASRIRAIVTTIFLWAYFMGAFVAGGFTLFLVAGLLRGRRGIGWASSTYTRTFLFVVRLVIPGLRLAIPERRELRQLRSTVVVCNHLSFLDPLLMLAYLPRLISIVRPDFFRVPIFGWILHWSGFLGPDLFAEGQPWIDHVARHIRSGGNLLIFPEGTRSRDGRLAPFKKGAFFLAKHLAAPILVLRIDGTDHLFPAGRLTFDVGSNCSIEVRKQALVSVEEAADSTTHELTARARAWLEPAQARSPAR